MEGKGEKEEEEESKELHRLHKKTWDGNQVVKKSSSSSNKPQARTGNGLRACAAPQHREHVLTYSEEALLQTLEHFMHTRTLGKKLRSTVSRNAEQTHYELHNPRTAIWLEFKKDNNIKCWRGRGALLLSHITDENAKRCNHFWQQFGYLPHFSQ